MKRIEIKFSAVILLLSLQLCGSISYAQVPQKMSYQAVIRNSSDKLVTNTQIGMKISILQTTATGTALYTETQTTTTNANGLVSIEFGGGAGFETINWANGPYFLKTETDITGGTNYTITGTSQLLSVPYALAAGSLAINKNSLTYDTYMKDDGTYMGLVKITVQQPFATEPTVTDIDGNVYGTVKIGTQVWMTSNLRTTRYRNGDAIPNVTANAAWAALTTGAYCTYNNTTKADSITLFGRLYNFYAVADSRNIAPVGWHVPTDAEWTTLTNYLGALAGGRLKESGTTHWYSPNTDALNDSKFSALPGGYRNYGNGTFYGVGGSGYWWSSAEYGTSTAWFRYMGYDSSDVGRYGNSKTGGFSVRCLRDSQ